MWLVLHEKELNQKKDNKDCDWYYTKALTTTIYQYNIHGFCDNIQNYVI